MIDWKLESILFNYSLISYGDNVLSFKIIDLQASHSMSSLFAILSYFKYFNIDMIL